MPWYRQQNWHKHSIKQIVKFVFFCVIFLLLFFFIVLGICMKMGSWRVHLFLWLIPHLEAQSLLWFAISLLCSIRVGIMLLGGEGAAGADEHLKPLKFYTKIFAKLYVLRGRMKLRSCTDWAEWSLNHYFKCFCSWPISHQATVKLRTSCNCVGARTQFDVTYREVLTAVLRIIWLGYLWLE